MIGTREEAIEYLDSLIGSGIRPGLDRMRAMLDSSGRPERSVPAVLVAGTNGKGSTAATLAAISRAAGYRVGLYTSPHLVSIEERWRVDEQPVEEKQFVRAVNRLERSAVVASITPTYFEALTLLAFYLFEESDCDLAVLEVGMGGRLDATNVVDPVLSVITAIDFDHQEWLGSTIREIASEKLGIARRGRPLVVSPQSSEAAASIRQRAAEIGSDLHEVSEEVEVESFETGLFGASAVITSPVSTYEIGSRLAGEHQAGNLATAIRAAEILSAVFPKISVRSIERGCASVVWRGRLETFDLDGRLVLVDGAHNPAGAASAASFIDRFLPRPRLLVFGVLEDKDVGSMLRPLTGLFDQVILTTPDSERGRSPESYAELASVGSGAASRIINDDVTAIRSALAEEGRTSIVICGSLYLAGTAVRLLDEMMAADLGVGEQRSP